MSNLSIFNPSSALANVGGRSAKLPVPVRRELSAIQNQTIVKVARVQAAEYVAGEGMHAIVGLTELEGQLATLSPLSTSRLQVIGNMATLQIVRILHG